MNQIAKTNCWEFKACGKEPGGINVDSTGVCPASLETKTHGIHYGINAGRCCWVIEGTFCDNTTQANFIDKFKDCSQCDFYALVTREERDITPLIKLSEIIKTT